MDPDLYRKIIKEIEEIDSVETIFFGGIAEPFSNPNILTMLKAAVNTNKKVEVITNGTFLDETLIKKLLSMNIDTLWVSLDGASQESYEEIRSGSNYNEVIDSLKLFNQLKYRFGGKTKLGIAFVAMKSNVHQIPELIKLTNSLHASELKISNVIPFDKNMRDEVLYSNSLVCGNKSEDLFDVRSTFQPIISLPIMDFEKPQVKGILGEVFQNASLLRIGENSIVRKSGHCNFINDNCLFIRWDGEFSPCMALLHNNITYLSDTERRIEHCSFGNAKESKITDIWNNKDYFDFRSRVRKFDFSPCTICGHCNYVDDNSEDCYGNQFPTCGGCLWAEGFARCP
ncbi:SPASM domain-containing protein [Sinanaerobacter chloroacetimidivorans]|uniref:SPASM domain-containing protein n=1 Tax=Sinanaerobacter chloroacetimidivorans TaxID=2818044 RepID=A0A8J7W3N1_9FIRM|nr:SPASM domain-containing protein [Sinanaerobacter chloroacetimidivorans]MBR0598563.1 SPASM domain-containing protein [Sinanaerobacter chloroacetimidivorans]